MSEWPYEQALEHQSWTKSCGIYDVGAFNKACVAKPALAHHVTPLTHFQPLPRLCPICQRCIKPSATLYAVPQCLCCCAVSQLMYYIRSIQFRKVCRWNLYNIIFYLTPITASPCTDGQGHWVCLLVHKYWPNATWWKKLELHRNTQQDGKPTHHSCWWVFLISLHANLPVFSGSSEAVPAMPLFSRPNAGSTFPVLRAASCTFFTCASTSSVGTSSRTRENSSTNERKKKKRYSLWAIKVPEPSYFAMQTLWTCKTSNFYWFCATNQFMVTIN